MFILRFVRDLAVGAVKAIGKLVKGVYMAAKAVVSEVVEGVGEAVAWMVQQPWLGAVLIFGLTAVAAGGASWLLWDKAVAPFVREHVVAFRLGAFALGFLGGMPTQIASMVSGSGYVARGFVTTVR